MPNQAYAVTKQQLELRGKALAANIGEIPQLKETLIRLDALVALLTEVIAQQASLTASKQEVSRRLAELIKEGKNLITFVDAGIRHHYGNRSEKLVEFGQQPFRSQPRLKLVGEDGKPLKRRPAEVKPPVPPPAE
jgi:hypothetical protein